MALNSYQQHQLEHNQLGNNSFINHNGLNGLLNDDHTQYACLTGRAGGQTLHGGFEEGDNLTLQASAYASDVGTITAFASSVSFDTWYGYKIVFEMGDQINAKLGDESGTPLYLNISSNANVILCNNGKVGINNFNPEFALDVTGNCRITSTLNLSSLIPNGVLITDPDSNVVAIDPSYVPHSALGSLSKDDHSQYLLLAGRSGGQTIIGGTDASNTLILQSTSNETLGSIQLGVEVSKAIILDEITGNIGIGKVPSTTKLEVNGSVLATSFTATGVFSVIRNDPNNFIKFVPQGGIGSRTWWVGGTRSGSGIASAGTFFIRDETARATRLKIDSSGRVGIGEIEPAATLDVAGDCKISSTVKLSGLTASRSVLCNSAKNLVSAAAPVTTALTGNVSLTATNTFYAGPSLTLSAGTWLVAGQITVSSGSATTKLTAKLYNTSTTVYASVEGGANANLMAVFPITKVITLATTTTVRIDMAANDTGCVMLATPPDNNTDCGNTASNLSAIQIA